MNAEFKAALRRRFDALGTPRVDGASAGIPTPRDDAARPTGDGVQQAQAQAQQRDLAFYGAAASEEVSLPPAQMAVEEWSLYYHEGHPYYYNNYTGESVWAEYSHSYTAGAASESDTTGGHDATQKAQARRAQSRRAVTRRESSSSSSSSSSTDSSNDGSSGDDSDSSEGESSATSLLLKAKFQEYLRSSNASDELLTAAQHADIRAAEALEASEIHTSRRRRKKRRKKATMSVMQVVLGVISSVAAGVVKNVSLAAARLAAAQPPARVEEVEEELGEEGGSAGLAGAEARVRSLEATVRAEGGAVTSGGGGTWARLVPAFLSNLQERCLPSSLLHAEVVAGSAGTVLVMLGETTLELASYVFERTGEGVIAVAASVWSGIEGRLREFVAPPGEQPPPQPEEGFTAGATAVDQLEAQLGPLEESAQEV